MGEKSVKRIDFEQIEPLLHRVLSDNREQFKKLSANSDWAVFAHMLAQELQEHLVQVGDPGRARSDGPLRTQRVKPEIEKGVRMPGWRNHKYPWESMEIGDSFWAAVSVNTLLTAANQHAKFNNNGRHYYCRPEGKGARIWRVKPPENP